MDTDLSAADEPLVLDRFLPYRLSILSNTISGAIARLYEERFGLTILEWRIMAVLGLDAPLSANGVCDRTRMDKVQVSRAVSRLLEKGLLSRKVANDDRRRSALSLSAKGRRFYGDIAPLTAEWEARLLATLSPAELRTIDSLVTKLQGEADRLANGELVSS